MSLASEFLSSKKGRLKSEGIPKYRSGEAKKCIMWNPSIFRRVQWGPEKSWDLYHVTWVRIQKWTRKGQKGCEGRRVEPNTRTFCAMKCPIKSRALHHWEYSRRRGTSFMEYLPGSKHIIKINHHSPVR